MSIEGMETRSESVVITGASTGIGRATALHLASLGFRVFAGIRKPGDGEALVEESSGAVEPISLEVTDPGSIEEAAEHVRGELGAGGELRGVVNNAGYALETPLEFVDRDALRHQFDVNVIGLADVTKTFLPQLRRPGGRIVNVSSGAGQIAIPLSGAYSASKYAVEAMSDALRVEVRNQGLHVSLVVPGFIESPIHEKNAVRAREMLEALPPVGRERYGPAFERMRRSMERRARHASPALDVAKAIEKALTAKRPRARYPVTFEANLLSVVGPFLGSRVRDAIFGREVGL